MDLTNISDAINVGGIPFEGGYSEENIRKTTNFKTRDGDIFLTTYPRSGTTWTQNILLGIKYGTAYLESSNGNQLESMGMDFPYLELPFPRPGYHIAEEMNYAPRFLKTHLPVHLAPREMFSQNRKNIVVARNPKDTALSLRKFYQNNITLKRFNTFENLDDFLEHFVQGKVNYGSWWSWNKDWIQTARKSPHMHLIHYEDYHEQFEEEVQKLTSFLNFDPLSNEEMHRLKLLVSVDQMKIRYADESHIKDYVNQGKCKTWAVEMPTKFVEMFDALTKDYFEGDQLLAKFM